MAGVIPTREAWERVRRAVRTSESDRREQVEQSTRRPRENTPHIFCAVITARSGTLNATYDAEAVGNPKMAVTTATPANRLIDGANYLAADVGALCIMLDRPGAQRVIWVAETIGAIDCEEPEEEPEP
ncbi:MAG: hypothetical protein KF847_19735 [Pirellulales bacterium]|nr:hypothetical protein [Pirellulales bacterium]